MSRSVWILRCLIAFAVFLAAEMPAIAQEAYFAGEPLGHPFVRKNDHVFVALDDIAVPLGLSVVYDGERLLVGGTIHGTLSVNPESHSLRARGQEIDYEEALFQEDGSWYLPDRFLELALGLRVRFNPETDRLDLFPVVVAITPTEGAVRITSSLPPIYRTFELESPSRRVIDINGAYLGGQCMSVPGAVLGISGLAALRASQFCEEPPTVRVVLEWDGSEPPNHTLFPELRTLAVLVGSGSLDSAPTGGANLLEGVGGNPAAPSSEVSEEGEGSASESTSEDDQQDSSAPGSSDESPIQEPIPDPPERDDPSSRFGRDPRLITPPVAPARPGPADLPSLELPEGAENLPLDQLGWQTSLELDSEGELVASIHCPPFGQLREFTLPGDEGMRLVLDLTGTYVPGDERSLDGLGDLQRIRVAQFEESITRIVFDLSRHTGYQIEKDPEKGEIVVKLLAGSLSGKTVVIDPGHGGEDPGAVVDGVMEKDLNLKMSFRLRDLLAQQGARVVLTRTGDYYVTLADRLAIAKRERADLFICVHNNATEEPTALQGALILCGDDDYDDRERMRLYKLVHASIAEHTKVTGLGPVPDKRGLYLLRHAGDLPVLFVEAAFMTNRVDLARLTDPSGAYSENIVLGVAQGVRDFYEGRQPVPVSVPNYALASNGDIFDLTGRPIVEGSDEGHVTDADATWDAPAEVSGEDGEQEDDESEEGEAEDSDDGSEDEDEGDEPERSRGRGAYRFD